MSISTYKNLILSFTLVTFSFILGFLDLIWFDFFFFLSAFLVLGYVVLKNFGAFSLFFVFIFLFGLYTFSLPLSIFLKLDVGVYREKYLAAWPKYDHTLSHYLLSSKIFFVGVIVVLFFLMIYIGRKITRNISNKKEINAYSTSIISGIVANVFELINFIRVGGFSALSKGKAFYQSAISDIPLTLPSEGFFFISIILFALSIPCIKKHGFNLKIVIFVLVNLFYIFINLIIGERGTLFLSFVFFIISYKYNHFLNEIKLKHIILGIFFMFFISLLTIYRNFYDDKNVKPTLKNIYSYINTHKNRIYFSLNPANIEFSAPALVYRVYIENNKDITPKYGITYLNFLANSIPVYINPYRAPSLLNEVRDKYFKDRVKRGSNSTMGYSLLLESYINFLFFGPLLISIFITFLLLLLESQKKSKNIFLVLLYILSFNFVLLLFRSTSEFIVQSFLLYVIQIIIVLFISSFLKYLNLIKK